MARAVHYPPADRTARWFQDSYRGADITPNVLVWHTTETSHVPHYNGGASAPHLTYDPDGHRWYQHFRLDRSARALRNLSGGVQTNTLNACQVEIIAYSDERLARERGHLPVSDLDDRTLRDLGEFAAFMWDEWGLKLDIDPGWVRSNYTTPHRMTGSEWRNFYGHTGHNRVPENTHWDPARLDIDTIIHHAKGDDMPTADEVADAILDRVLDKVDPESGNHPRMRVRNYLRWIHYSATLARVEQNPAVIAELERVGSKMDALIAAHDGLDGDAVLGRIDAHHAETLAALRASAEREEAQLDLIEQALSGEADAAEVLRALADMIRREVDSTTDDA